MTGNSYSVFNAMVDIVAAPGKALDEIKLHPSWFWVPLLITITLACGMFAYYYNWVDFPWLVDETIRQVPVEKRAESANAIRQFMDPGRQTWTTVVAIIIMSFLIYVIQASYLHLANKLITGAEIGFGNWFSFSVWTAFVGVFSSLSGFVMIFMADSNQLATQSLQPLSLNALFIHAQPGDPLFTWASSLTLINIWTFFLMSIGYARWTGCAQVRATVIAVLPWAMIYGVWAAVASR
ncbi:MAG: YIP1 family protein [Lysobacterales bacterium]